MFKVITYFSNTNPNGMSFADKPKTFRFKNYKQVLLRVIVTVLLVGLLWRLKVNWLQILSDLSSANLIAVAASIGLIFPIIFLKAWRWKFILSNYQIEISLKDATSLYGSGLSAGSITPGQAGDFMKAFPLQNKGFSLGNSLLSIFLDRLFDLFVLILLALWGLFELGSSFNGQLPLFFILLSVTGLSILILVCRLQITSGINRKINNIITSKITKGKAAAPSVVAQIPENHSSQMPRLSLKITLYSFLFTSLTAVLAIARTWLLGLALGTSFSPLAALTISSLATIASLVPITINGIGTRDVVLVGVMAQLGFSSDTAISLSTLLLLVNLFNFFAGYIVWFIFRPLDIQNKA
jgi:uncharacterized protein (TIRG00374 family)